MCVLERKIPDRVPHFEWMVDLKVRKALCPGAKDPLDFYDQMGWDAVIADTCYQKEKVGEGRWLSDGVLLPRILPRNTALKLNHRSKPWLILRTIHLQIQGARSIRSGIENAVRKIWKTQSGGSST